MRLIIDGSNKTLLNPFTYRNDPTIAEIKPLISFLSGGRMITIHGTNFDIIQKPEMFIYVDSNFDHPINKSVSFLFYCIKTLKMFLNYYNILFTF